MSCSWETTTFSNEDEIFRKLLCLQGKRWLCRGQAEPFGKLIPSIDRGKLKSLSRPEKLMCERESIDIFRATARFFSHPGEQGALTKGIIALMVLRHYGVPTRLLDWSVSPYVAAYFATCSPENRGGEIWAFDEPLYEEKGKEQWERWPETTTDGSGNALMFDAELTAFDTEEPPDWFICGFYPSGFPRQDAQRGAYSMTARFGTDHAEAIPKLLGEKSCYHKWIIPADLKSDVQKRLREKHGIWEGSLLPDVAGAAKTAEKAFPS